MTLKSKKTKQKKSSRTMTKKATAKKASARKVVGEGGRIASRRKTREKKISIRNDLSKVILEETYAPSVNEEYMSDLQLAYFQRKLFVRRNELINQSQETLNHLKTETRDVSDEAERASRESDNILELRTRDRYRKLLSKIDSALRRIEDGSYGYCEETGEEIGIKRLEARPTATLTVDAQERREMLQRQFRDDR